MVNILTTNFLGFVSPRQRDILRKRFGLPKGEGLTLAAIGDEYDLTRERVRQIEESALGAIRKKFSADQEFQKIARLAVNYLEERGDLVKEEDFLDALRESLKEKVSDNYLKFILAVIEDPEYHFEDADFHGFWHLGHNRLNDFFKFVEETEKFLAKLKQIILQKEFENFLAERARAHHLDDVVALNYLKTSKKFGFNHFGDFGLSEWPEINLKTAGAKAHLILQKHGAPLHFREIGKRMGLLKSGRRVMHQTVHNELIKDPRFVLVGRGIYGLTEFGLEPGFAKDVIARLLKKRGPLPKEKIIELVKKERALKDNTIAINLHNRKNFRRLADGRYTLK